MSATVGQGSLSHQNNALGAARDARLGLLAAAVRFPPRRARTPAATKTGRWVKGFPETVQQTKSALVIAAAAAVLLVAAAAVLLVTAAAAVVLLVAAAAVVIARAAAVIVVAAAAAVILLVTAAALIRVRLRGRRRHEIAHRRVPETQVTNRKEEKNAANLFTNP